MDALTVALERSAEAVCSAGDRAARAAALATVMRESGRFAWVGVHEVAGDGVHALASEGNDPGGSIVGEDDASHAAASCGRTVSFSGMSAAADDPSGESSELAVPVRHPVDASICAVITVRRDRCARLCDDDIDLVEACAAIAGLIWADQAEVAA